MASNREWQRALNLAWGYTNNLSELVWLLRTSAEVSRKHQGWIAFLIEESSFQNRNKQEIDSGRIRIRFSNVPEIAADERRDVADFLAKGRIGRKRAGNVKKPPWRLANSLED